MSRKEANALQNGTQLIQEPSFATTSSYEERLGIAPGEVRTAEEDDHEAWEKFMQAFKRHAPNALS